MLESRRQGLLDGGDAPDVDLADRARALLHPGPRRVLNGTGVIIHTNLGRAPLAASAAAAVAAAAEGYVDLELDLATGRRGPRDAHAIAVNNGAAATLLAAAALAGPGAVIAVSRGQLVEIGGGFRCLTSSRRPVPA